MAIKPIILTQFGDVLEMDAEWRTTNDETEMSLVSYIGWHQTSRNFMHLKPASVTHNRLCCQPLGLSIPVPKTVTTYGQLRQWCADQLRAETQREVALTQAVMHFTTINSPDSSPPEAEGQWNAIEEALG